ncbi:hyastatin-like [Portunus trituberculatus]|uniref:Antimicrobial peptide hyastatin n=1 Tax=Portunus trituberculatus TaxID=210409 RepID=F2VIN4_PORTR|nr:hyastatin-like [Portunus trituberculatus]XP_045124473.1 hyastatin-like [Portunus trituberculatus]ADQ55791.1 antimicrobial peptide hyastatin [Portunus trituberculatus]ADQ55792.1 antimicrobial peptide hyastatin [Portunus trituberculatus]ADQ55803.1 antimicrobial peptide hyastatin [Portunus trituberculatus]ADQ55804.1 antimicrobial peptide hyastatin [Portunus trituberculatus]ADQ55805.1 antimicrobial peptide hyastatin [Portunus trituberculatus]
MHVLLLLACLAAVGNAYNAKVPVQVLPERFDTFPGRNPSLTRPAVVGVQTLPGRVPPQTLPGVVGVSPLVSPGRPGITGSIRPFQRPGQYSFTRYNCRRQCPGYESGNARCCRLSGDCCGNSYPIPYKG